MAYVLDGSDRYGSASNSLAIYISFANDTRDVTR